MGDTLFGARLERVLLAACAPARTAADELRPFAAVLALRLVARRFSDAILRLLVPVHTWPLYACDGVVALPQRLESLVFLPPLLLARLRLEVSEAEANAWADGGGDNGDGGAAGPRLSAEAWRVLRGLGRLSVVMNLPWGHRIGDIERDAPLALAACRALRPHVRALYLVTRECTFTAPAALAAVATLALDGLDMSGAQYEGAGAGALDLAPLAGLGEVLCAGCSESAVGALSPDVRVGGGAEALRAVVVNAAGITPAVLDVLLATVGPRLGVGARSNPRHETLLHAAADALRPDLVRALLVLSMAELDAPDLNGETPLHHAVDFCVFQDLNNGTPAAVAAAAETVHVLLAAGASVGARANNGRTAAWAALLCANAEVLESLGALDVCERDCDGRTPLHAAVGGSAESLGWALPWLLRVGAALDAVDAAGYTPLAEIFRAATMDWGGVDPDNVRIAEMLLAAGASPRRAPASKHGPLADACANYGWLPVVRRMLALGGAALVHAEERRLQWRCTWKMQCSSLLMRVLHKNDCLDPHSNAPADAARAALVAGIAEFLRVLLAHGASRAAFVSARLSRRYSRHFVEPGPLLRALLEAVPALLN